MNPNDYEIVLTIRNINTDKHYNGQVTMIDLNNAKANISAPLEEMYNIIIENIEKDEEIIIYN